MAGYTRTDLSNNISNGNLIDADDLDNEFDAVQAAFNATTGHKHDGTAGEGAPITKLGPVQDVVASSNSLIPKTSNFMDFGTSSFRWKDGYFAGSINADFFTSTNVDGTSFRAGTDLVAAPGYTWVADGDTGMYHPAANTIGFVTNASERVRISNTGLSVTGTITSSGSITGNLIGNVTGNVTGDVTGSVTGNAATATRLGTPRSFSVSGGATASGVAFDGTAPVALNVTALNANMINTGIVDNDRLPSTMTGKSFTTGISFGSSTAASLDDVTRHIRLYGTAYGFNVTSNRLNIVVPSGSRTSFINNGTEVGWVNSSGFGGNGSNITGITIGQTSGNIPNARIVGTYDNFTDITGSGTAFFNAFTLTGGQLRGVISDTNTAPTYTWNGDNNTGMYRYGLNSIGWSTGGVNGMILSSNQNLTVANDVYADAFHGDGSDLTSLSAGNISSGTMSISRMSTTTGARDWVLDRLAAISSHGVVGSYAMLSQISGTAANPGQTRLGSVLNYAHGGGVGPGTIAPSGTWMCMADIGGVGSGDASVGLWLRVA